MPITCSGKGATKQVVKKFNDAIAKQWTGQFGKYNVKTVVTSGPENQITVPVGAGDATVKNPCSVAAHESGHLLELVDRYTDLNNDGFWEPSEQDTGWEGDLMADPENGAVSEKGIFFLLVENHATDSGNCDCKK